MGAPQRKNLIAIRRRFDEDEDEEGSTTAGVEEDSLSEGSGISDADDDADAEGSDISDVGAPKRGSGKRRALTEKHSDDANGRLLEPILSIKSPPTTAAMADTEAMMNGMQISRDGGEVEEIHFDNLNQEGEMQQKLPESEVLGQTTSERTETLLERRRREHEEYKKKRDADPAFVPNRGGFFMHDHRSATPGQNGFRPSGRGRGRGRGGMGIRFSPMKYVDAALRLY